MVLMVNQESKDLQELMENREKGEGKANRVRQAKRVNLERGFPETKESR